MCAAALPRGGLSPCPHAKDTQSETPADFLFKPPPICANLDLQGPLMRTSTGRMEVRWWSSLDLCSIQVLPCQVDGCDHDLSTKRGVTAVEFGSQLEIMLKL